MTITEEAILQSIVEGLTKGTGKLMEELTQYRALGTVEELKTMKEKLKRIKYELE